MLLEVAALIFLGLGAGISLAQTTSECVKDHLSAAAEGEYIPPKKLQDGLMSSYTRGGERHTFFVTNRSFDHIMSTYFDDMGVHKGFLGGTKNALKFMRGKRVLDIGCGGGDFVIGLRKRKIAAYGVDIDKLGDWSGKTYLIEADAMRMPFPDRSFDVEFSTQSVVAMIYSNTPDQIRYLKEMERVLKPGGLLFLDVFENSISEALKSVPGLKVKTDFGRQSGRVCLERVGP